MNWDLSMKVIQTFLSLEEAFCMMKTSKQPEYQVLSTFPSKSRWARSRINRLTPPSPTNSKYLIFYSFFFLSFYIQQYVLTHIAWSLRRAYRTNKVEQTISFRKYFFFSKNATTSDYIRLVFKKCDFSENFLKMILPLVAGHVRLII